MKRLRLMLAALAAVFAASPALAAHSEAWTYNGSGTGDPGHDTGANYDAANAWKDSNGEVRTFDTAATVARDYIVPAGKTLISHHDTAGDAGEWRFTANDDTFILRGSSTAVAHLRSSARRLYLPLLVMEDNSKLSLGLQDSNTTRWYQTVLGTIRVDAAPAYPAVIQAWNYYEGTQTNAATVVGSGALYYVSRNSGGPNISTVGALWLTECDASGFTGPVKIGMSDGGTGRARMHVYVKSADNIGGNPASPLEKNGLELAGVTLHVQGDVVLPVNRWLYIATNTPSTRVDSQGALVDVASGKTFTIPNSVGFQSGDYALIKHGGGTLSLPGWAANGTVKVTTGTLEITGASVAEGVVTPATVGKLEMSGDAKVTVRVTGDGSVVNLNDVRTLVTGGGALPSGIEVVNDGAFTFAPDTKGSYSVDENGNLVMTVVEYVPEWTLNTNNGVYTNANVWTDETGSRRTWTAEAAATKIEYIVPADMTVRTPTGGLSTDLYAFSTHPDSTVTVRTGGGFESNVMYAYVPNLVLESGTALRFWIANNKGSAFRSARSVAGTLHIEAPESNPAVITSRGYYSDPVRTNAMDMVGSGAVYYTRYSSATTAGIFYATGDNSGFTGPLAVKDAAAKTDKKMYLHVSSSENIGGNPDAYTEKGFELHSAQLLVHGDVVLGSNRGFYVSSNSVVDVDSGKSFTSPNAVVLTEGTTLSKAGAGAMNVPGWTTGTIAVSAGTLNIDGVTFADGAVETPVAIGGIEYSSGATVKLAVAGDGSELPFANATNVLLEAESALPADFAGKVQLVGDNAFTVPSRLKTRLVVVDGTKLALETEKDKGFMLIVK